MEPWFSVGEALLGVVVLLFVIQDVFRVVVMPRPYYGRSLTKAMLRTSWRLWRRVAIRRTDGLRREGVLGIFGQLGLLILLGFWAAGLTLGYGLIFDALREQLRPAPGNFGTSLYVAGVSLLTLGLGDIVPVGGPARLVMLVTAASGPALIGLVLALLFSLNSSFQRREALVTTLDASAGAPPSGVRMLETYAALGIAAELPAMFRLWELWTAEVLDSHLSYPLLAFFRSTHDNESWISALGAVLDAATLTIAAIEVPAGNAQLMYDLGCHAVEDLTGYFGLVHERDVGVEFVEFEAALVTLAEAGLPVILSDVAWERFRVLRERYAGALNVLARNFVTPPALWIGDRSTLHAADARL